MDDIFCVVENKIIFLKDLKMLFYDLFICVIFAFAYAFVCVGAWVWVCV